MTAILSVDYRRPVYIGVAYEVEAWLEREDRRKMHCLHVARDANGKTVTECRALFVEVDLSRFRGTGTGLPW